MKVTLNRQNICRNCKLLHTIKDTYTICGTEKCPFNAEFLKHEQELESKRKFKKRDRITSLDELMKQDFVYIHNRLWNRGWFQNLYIGLVKGNLGRFYYAIKKENENAENN